MKQTKVYFVKFPDFDNFVLKYRIAVLLTFLLVFSIVFYKVLYKDVTRINEIISIIIIFTYTLLWLRERMFRALIQTLEKVFMENIQLFQEEKNNIYLIKEYPKFDEYKKSNKKINYSFLVGFVLMLIIHKFIPLVNEQLINVYPFLLRLLITTYFTLLLYKELYSIFKYFQDIAHLYNKKGKLISNEGIQFPKLPKGDFYIIRWRETVYLCGIISLIVFILQFSNYFPVYLPLLVLYIFYLFLLGKMTIEVNCITKRCLQVVKQYDVFLKKVYGAELFKEEDDFKAQLSSEVSKRVKDIFQ